MRRIATAFALTLIALTASASTFEETFDQTYDVRPGALVSLANTNGRITVHAWDQPRVRIHADKRVQGSGDAAKEAMAALKIEVSAAGGGLRVMTRYPKQGADGFLDWMFGSHV